MVENTASYRDELSDSYSVNVMINYLKWNSFKHYSETIFFSFLPCCMRSLDKRFQGHFRGHLNSNFCKRNSWLNTGTLDEKNELCATQNQGNALSRHQTDSLRNHLRRLVATVWAKLATSRILRSKINFETVYICVEM